MKTLNDLNALIPMLTQKFINAFNEDHLDNGYNNSGVYYEEDGWMIDISFDIYATFTYEGDGWDLPCTRSLDTISTSNTKIEVDHLDEETDEETKFTEDDCYELYVAFDNILDEIYN